MTAHARRPLSRHLNGLDGQVYEPVAGQFDDHLYGRIGRQLAWQFHRQLSVPLRDHLEERHTR